LISVSVESESGIVADIETGVVVGEIPRDKNRAIIKMGICATPNKDVEELVRPFREI
jgi:hypothetical protein